MADKSPTEILPYGAQQDAGDEVKSKPSKPNTLKKLPKEEPLEEETGSGYYDILLVGRTGMGKSSTADKVMVINTPAIPKQEQQARPVAESGGRPQKTKLAKEAKKKKKKSNKLHEIDDTHREKVQYENVTGWIISNDPDEQENFNTRIKNIIFCRQTSEEIQPHANIDNLRNDKDLNDDVYKSSRSCQLLINEDSMIQILDAPGFFSPDFMEGTSNASDSNLAIVRHIVCIQALAGLRFKRILYFLPTPGPLKRADRTMQEEIQKMVKFFGVSIFKQMVLVGTAQKDITDATDIPRERKFKAERLEESREYFHEALVREFKEKGKNVARLPKPPIIFIAMTDTCEDILHMIISAKIDNDSDNGFKLEFNANTCFRCGIETGMKEDKTLIAEYRGPGAAPWVDALPYEQTFCHPSMQSKYTTRSVFRGLARMFLFKWKFSEELCVSCNKAPGAMGCEKVFTMYEEEGYEPIEVNHTYEIDKPRVRKAVQPETETSTITNTAIQNN